MELPKFSHGAQKLLISAMDGCTTEVSAIVSIWACATASFSMSGSDASPESEGITDRIS